MSLETNWRNIDCLLKNKAIVKLVDGNEFKGFGDCLISLPINDDTDEEAEFLRFITDNSTEYLLEEDIESYEIIK